MERPDKWDGPKQKAAIPVELKEPGQKKNNNPSMGCEHKQHTQEVL